MGYPASDVMDRAAAFMNDQAREVYDYDVQIPYLKTAMTDLQQEYEIHNVPVTNVTSTPVTVDAGDFEIQRVGNPLPNYPANLVEPQQLWERLAGSDDPYMPLTKFEFIPHNREGVNYPYLRIWSWEEEIIKFVPQGATADIEVKIDYIKSLFDDVQNENTIINVTNSLNFLAYRTAALLASFIAENPTRASELNAEARIAIDQSLGIGSKGRQSIATRRRPFMASYRSRRSW